MKKEKETKTVIFVETNMLKKLSKEVKEELLYKIAKLGHKTYTTETADNILRLKKPEVIRFGFIPDRISSSVRVKGGKIISGDI